MEGFVTLLFIKVDGQNLAKWGTLMCSFKKDYLFLKLKAYNYDVIIGVYHKGLVTLPF